MRRFLVLLLVSLVPACGGDSRTIIEPGPVARVIIDQGARVTMKYIDEERQLTATARDADGGVVSGVSFTWESLNPSVVTVDASGLVVAQSVGTASVSVRTDEFSAIVIVEVTGETDLTFLRTFWSGEAVFHGDGGAVTLPVVAQGSSEVGGAASKLRLVVGDTDLSELVVLTGIKSGSEWLALGDGRRGTMTVMQGEIVGGRGEWDSRERLGDELVERMVFGEFREDSFESMVEISEDGGQSWQPVWSFVLERESVTVPEVTTAEACQDPAYGDFDFWAGNWTVYDPSDNQVGSNRIHPVVAGCGIQENWQSSGGGTGISLNMRDARTGNWTQFYLASGGTGLELVGALVDGAMVLSGPRSPGSSLIDRITWTPREDGSVRQHWETSQGGTGWSTFFDGIYR